MLTSAMVLLKKVLSDLAVEMYRQMCNLDLPGEKFMLYFDIAIKKGNHEVPVYSL